MELDERKEKILKVIIRTYLETGEPVGSRTISKNSDLQLSSATIRNEMADLEQMGYILQPHTSSGRIPSDKGYRFYVDDLVREKEEALKEQDGPEGSAGEDKTAAAAELMISRVDRLEDLLKQMARLLAASTNYATMVSGPQYNRTKLKFVQLSRVEEGRLLIVTVLEGNIIKNSIVKIGVALTDQDILNLNILLNNHLTGLTMEQINLDVISQMKQQAGERHEVVEMVLNEVADAIRTNEEDLKIYTEGATNIFKYPELADTRQASQLLNALEQKEQLVNMMVDEQADNESGHGIQVYIGQETQVQALKDCSVVTASYDLGGGLKGTVGIIGPKRMDYEKVVETLRTLMDQLQKTFQKGSGPGGSDDQEISE